MPKQLNSEEEHEVRRIAEEALYDGNKLVRVETIDRGRNEGEIIAQVENDGMTCRNAWAGNTLKQFVEAGYIPVAVGGDGDSMAAWFRPIGVGLDL